MIYYCIIYNIETDEILENGCFIYKEEAEFFGDLKKHEYQSQGINVDWRIE